MGVENGVTGGTNVPPYTFVVLSLYMHMECEYFSTTDMTDK